MRKPTSSEVKELELNRTIKPKLRKFLIDKQVESASATSKQESEERKEMLKSEDIILQAEKLSKLAFFKFKLWQKIPPALEMTWLQKGASDENLIKEQNVDISGFAFYLVREYRNYLKLRNFGKGYRNPMSEEHLEFYWAKCQADLTLLIKADMLRKKAGNAGIIIPN